MPPTHLQNKSKRQRKDEAEARLRLAFSRGPQVAKEKLPADEVLAQAWKLALDIQAFAFKYLRHFMVDPVTGVEIPPAEFHKELYQTLLTEQFAAIAAPREHAKSTVVSVIFVLYCICLKLRKFIVIISDTQPQAALQLAAVKEEIETNAALKEDFGALMGDKKWDVNDCRTTTGISLVARGAGQSLRGLRFRQYRPDLVIIDDLENEEDVENPDSRAKLMRWFKGTVMNLGKHCQIFVIGTILHFDSFLSNLLDPDEFKRFVKRKYEAVDDEFHPESVLWPQKWDVETLRQKEQDLGSVIFNQEWRNRPISADTQVFKEADVLRHGFQRHELEGKQFVKITYNDPAISLKEKADFFASVTIGAEIGAGTLYVLRAEQKRMPFTEQIAFVVRRYDEERPVIVGVEEQAYQAALKQALDAVGKETGRYIPVVGVNNLSDKFLRISTMGPLVENGTIRFCLDGTQATLISQLLYLGKIKDDLADALQGAVQLARNYTFGAAMASGNTTPGGRDPQARRDVLSSLIPQQQQAPEFLGRDRKSRWA